MDLPLDPSPSGALRWTTLPRTPLRRTAQNFALFSFLPPQFSFFLSLGVLSLNFVGVFEASGPSDVHVVKPRRLWGPTFSRFGPPPFAPQKIHPKNGRSGKKKVAEVEIG